MNPSYTYEFKYIIIGNAFVGKTSLLKKFDLNRFSPTTQSTLTMEYIRKTIKINNKKIMLQIWDTSGQENLFSLTSSYYRNSCGVILVYDITNKSSFENLQNWIEKIQNRASEKIRIVLVGNKIDLENQREVSFLEGQRFAKKNGFLFFEVSAKILGEEVLRVFWELTKFVYLDILNGDLEIQEGGGNGVRLGNVKDCVVLDVVKEKEFRCC